jgi:hypothetical protein
VPYCDPVTDLVAIGDLPLPTYVDPKKWVDSTADEIDAKIGFLYHTPIDVDPLDDTQRPTYLLLKQINAHLACGRIILAAAIGGEDVQLQAYGNSLVKESLDALMAIASGKISLPGAVMIDSTSMSGPTITNKDPFSLVDAFYDGVSITQDPATQIPPFYGMRFQ